MASSITAEELKQALRQGSEARETIASLHPEDLADAVEELGVEDALSVLSLLEPDDAADLLTRIETDARNRVLEAMNLKDAASLIALMDPDDRADAVQELTDDVSVQLLGKLKALYPAAAQEIARLTKWEPETAGGLMTTQYVAVDQSSTVANAIDEVRRCAEADEAETIYYIYVLDGANLLGVVSLRDLMMAKAGTNVCDAMTRAAQRISPRADQEEVAEKMARYDLAALPIVSDTGKLLGVVTIDDVVDVVIEEATEDAQKMGGVVPLEDSYIATDVLEFVWKRGFWLVLLMLGQLLTVSVMEGNQGLLDSYHILTLFIPVIIAAGGNAGSQSATLVIRALAVGEVDTSDTFRVLWRELLIGSCLGILVGAIAFARAFFAGHHLDPILVAMIVGISVLTVVVISTTIGSLLPIAIRRSGLDPAVSSTPFIATIVDVLGLLTYFAVARLIFQQLL